MTDFSAQTFDVILTRMLQEIPDDFDTRDTSPIRTALAPAAWMLEGYYLALDKVQRQAFIQTAAGQSLDLLAQIAGLTRYPASPAVVLGAFNRAISPGARFSTLNGEKSINFYASAAVENPLQYRLTAETPGSAGNDYIGPILPITAIPGLTQAAITQVVIPGEDEESDDAFRARIITALNDRPFGGNIASYRDNILAIPGVGALQVYPTQNGGGTVLCSLLGADLEPAGEELIRQVQEAIDPEPGLGTGLAPIGAKVTITAPEAVAVNLSATVALEAGYTLSQVQAGVEEAVQQYINTVRQDWGKNVSDTSVAYSANVYIARVLAAVVGMAGVVNVSGLTLNGGTADLILTETGQLQQVPELGTVTLSE